MALYRDTHMHMAVRKSLQRGCKVFLFYIIYFACLCCFPRANGRERERERWFEINKYWLLVFYTNIKIKCKRKNGKESITAFIDLQNTWNKLNFYRKNYRMLTRLPVRGLYMHVCDDCERNPIISIINSKKAEFSNSRFGMWSVAFFIKIIFFSSSTKRRELGAM